VPKIVDHEKYKKELLTSAFECFAEKGYGQITMRDLAKSLGVSTGTLYHYFPSKQAIFEELVDHLAEQDFLMIAHLERKGSMKKRVEALLHIAMERQEYMVNQIMIWLEYARLYGWDSLRKCPAVTKIYVKLGIWMCDYLETDDVNVLAFFGSLMNGLMLEKSLNIFPISIEAQSAIIAGALKAAQDKKKS
jgi:AcrR family transcriptional regulator